MLLRDPSKGPSFSWRLPVRGSASLPEQCETLNPPVVQRLIKPDQSHLKCSLSRPRFPLIPSSAVLHIVKVQKSFHRNISVEATSGRELRVASGFVLYSVDEKDLYL